MKKILLLLSLPFYFYLSEAQQGFVAMGGDTKNSSGSISISVGQLANQFSSNKIHTVNQGLQHPYDDIVTTSILHLAEELNINIYPNPTDDLLWVTRNTEQNLELNYVITDLLGKTIAIDQVAVNTRINTDHFAEGLYILSFYTKNQFIQSFKIIKQ